MPLQTFDDLESLESVRAKLNAAIVAINVLEGVESASWGNISGILANQLDLQNALDLKVNTNSLATVASTGSYSDLVGIPSSFTPSAHTQAFSTITGTPTSLSGYGITDAYTETEVDALISGIVFPVTSVAGKTGAVTLTKSDVGLNNVDNTSDANKPVSTAQQSALDLKAPLETTQGTLTYSSTVNLDLASLKGTHQTISLTGNLTLSTSNRSVGRSVVIRLVGDSVNRTLTFPATWKFLGIKPTQLTASKVAILSLTFFGTADSDCIASFGVEL